jgi:hypothetical protein
MIMKRKSPSLKSILIMEGLKRHLEKDPNYDIKSAQGKYPGCGVNTIVAQGILHDLSRLNMKNILK